MRVYVETNFLLEWVLEQAETAEVERIVEMAAEGTIELLVPAACLLEAYVAMRGREARRRDLLRRLDQDLGDLGRSLSLRSEASALRGIVARSNVSMQSRYESLRTRVLAVAKTVALDDDIARSAMACEGTFALTVPDAIVFACVLADLAGRPPRRAIFATRNSKDFDTPDVRAALAARHCDLLFTFSSACARARAAAPLSPAR